MFPSSCCSDSIMFSNLVLSDRRNVRLYPGKKPLLMTSDHFFWGLENRCDWRSCFTFIFTFATMNHGTAILKFSFIIQVLTLGEINLFQIRIPSLSAAPNAGVLLVNHLPFRYPLFRPLSHLGWAPCTFHCYLVVVASWFTTRDQPWSRCFAL